MKLRVTYDKGADVLYIVSAPGRRAYAKETMPGVMWRFDADTDDRVGVTIIDFRDYWQPKMDALVDDISHGFSMPKAEIKRIISAVH